jgi:hypothetical protein
MIPWPPVYLQKAGYQWYSLFVPECCGWCANDLIRLAPQVNWCPNCGKVQAQRLGVRTF